MYSTCLYCARDLGENEVLETLPIGRRLAFDPAQGRLWVICRHCARWNLVPFDTRLESIDEAERLFRDTRTRFSTDNIGLARVPEGLELVRIGPALRPEFAAWRYGDRFASRRKRNIIIGTVAGAGVLAAYAGAAWLGAAGFAGSLNPLIQSVLRNRVVARFRVEGHPDPLTLTTADIGHAALVPLPDEEVRWGLSLPERTGVKRWRLSGRKIARSVLIKGSEAGVVLARILPAVAGTSGSRKQVASALHLLDQRNTLDGLVTAPGVRLRKGSMQMYGGAGTIEKLLPEARLAIEMLANEESERRWLEGELKLLERQWREAEKLAVIADGLALPESLEADLAQRKDAIAVPPE